MDITFKEFYQKMGLEAYPFRERTSEKEDVSKGSIPNFSFYEYYPRRKNARKNTNDIYSYIKYLSSLNNTDEFTNDELRSCANTGGSTTNYITGMMNIGLVKKTDLKRAGGSVIYKIIDPKITYAIYHDIEITHS